MGIADSRTPAVHRGARILDAVSSGAATTPAALIAMLGLPKSSIADLLGTLEDVGFVTRRSDGTLHTGPRLSDLSDPESVVQNLFRACATPDLEGHTISLVRMFGNQVVFVDVHLGRLPLPLTPRPGQRAEAAECAGAAAILSTLSAEDAADAVSAAARHLGLTADEVQTCLAVRHRRRRNVYESQSAHMGRQLACPVAGTRYALTLHVPQRWPEPAIAKAARALHTAAQSY
ncbi:helix-turn-helix domain-containing protein [Mycobacterium hodleri]|uniref:helix-turn-helix domain-containing protein n=1 Tax=Mycolicibacterium hodleri TaxID=49897 RepID=UPI0021F3AA20|nr:helix-turn-helix domain-containing protein [Mycolicibacterium hodleri]MCV7133367.1 helix-turn-helix domain-containing protein [Mycolicibacterium hodleri]